MPPAVVIGLGNPGPRYIGTRHNVGFEVVDRLAHQEGVSFQQGTGPYLVAETSELQLIRPTTFMNLSGRALVELRESLAGDFRRTLIVLDDVALRLGTLRLRRKGSDGGHNGLASVIEALGTTEVPRLRLGVGPELMPPAELLAEFVLARFEPQERAVVERMVARASNAVRMWVDAGIEPAMNTFNTQESEPNDPDH